MLTAEETLSINGTARLAIVLLTMMIVLPNVPQGHQEFLISKINAYFVQRMPKLIIVFGVTAKPTVTTSDVHVENMASNVHLDVGLVME